MRKVTRIRLLCGVVAGALATPAPAFADTGVLFSLSGREVVGVFLLLLALNTCSLLIIGACKEWVLPYLSPQDPERSSNGGQPSTVTESARAHTASARLKLPIDADSFQSWQSIAREGVKKTR